jgi:hypothetical protein
MQSLRIKDKYFKVYSIDESGVLIQSLKNPKLPTEEHIVFENIKRDRFYYVNKSPLLLVFSGLFLIISMLIFIDKDAGTDNLVVLITWPLFAIAFFILFFTYRERIYFIKTFSGKFIKFKIRKNEEEISLFVKTVIEKRDTYLKLKYGTPNSNLSYDSQYSNFNIMLREKIITQAEYLEGIDRLNGMFNQTKPMKTFPGYSQN